MSRRYGRNQRRAHRERIEALDQRNVALQAAMTMDRGLLASTTGKLRDAKDQIERVRRTLGPNTALLPPLTVALQGDARNRVMLEAFGGRPPSLAYDGSMSSMGQCAQDVELPALLSRVGRDGGPHGRAVHVKVRFADQQLGYAISEEAMRDLPLEILVGDIAQALAEQLGPALKRMRP